MKIYNREDFLKLPSGTIFRKGGNCYFGNIQIKGKSLENDFLCMEIGDWDAEDDGNYFDKFDQMQNGTTIPMTDDYYGRDGLFEDNALFLVLESNDLFLFKGIISQSIEETRNENAGRS